ncbi:3605_t:CDS:2 [Entrophospora sp. SA101]|nr:3605_t:CDS:2 [Entrophospora sp. SA101]
MATFSQFFNPKYSYNLLPCDVLKEKLKEKELDKLDVTNINEKLNNENDGWDNTGKHANDLVDDGDEAELDKLDVINNDED